VSDCLVLYRTHPGQGHLHLARLEHDVLWLIEHRFAGPGRHREQRRTEANLYTRLFVYEALSRNPARSWRNLLRALRAGPHRVVLLPLEAMRRRAHRRVARMRRRDEPELRSLVSSFTRSGGPGPA
jgi:hypothetical protein